MIGSVAIRDYFMMHFEVFFPHVFIGLIDVSFFFLFKSLCAQYSADKREEEKMCDHLIRAAKYRDHVTATQLIQKIVNILTDKHGAWGSSALR